MTTFEGLRAWARGMYALEAAVELLIRFAGGRFAQVGWPWIVEGADWIGVDSDGLVESNLIGLSGGERRMLMLVAAFFVERPVDLSDVAGLDRANLELLLAAIAHAGGSHEHSHIEIDHEAGVVRDFGMRPSLYPWPAFDEAAAVTG